MRNYTEIVARSAHAITAAFRLKGLILCATPPIIWAVCFTTNKIGLEYFTPTQQVTFQLIAASFVSITCVTLFQMWQGLRIQLLVFLAFLGLLEPGMTYFLGSNGLKTADAGIASVIFSCEAVITIFLVILFRIEYISMRLFLLSLFATLGVSLIVSSEIAVGNIGALNGYVYLFLSVLMASLYAIGSTKLNERSDAFYMVMIQQVFALGLLSGIFFFTGESLSSDMLYSVPPIQWANLAITGVAQFPLAYGIYLLAIQREGPFRAVVFLNLLPVMGLAVGYVVLGETLNFTQLIGGAIAVVVLFWISTIREEQPSE